MSDPDASRARLSANDPTTDDFLPQQDEDDRDYYDSQDRDTCWACHGEGYVHDCGEDTCCCLNPDVDYCYPCEECNGRGEI